MALNRTHIDARPDEVFEVLADGSCFADWVVGAKRVRAVDSSWPAVDARLHHTIGVGPLALDDDTKVVEVNPPTHLVLEAKGRPLGRARVELQIAADGDGARVTMIENLFGAPAALGKLFDMAVHVRNVETLRRLRRLVERRAASQPAR